LKAAKATFALNAGVWFRRTRFVISSPDPQQTSPHSGRKSTHPTVQIPQASSDSALANIPTRPGRDKHYADSSRGPDALEYCALIVATVWRAHAGKWPGNKNPHAFELCEALWTASGGEAHGGLASENGALTAWRRHLTASKKFRPPHAAGELVEQWRKTAAGEAAEPVNPNGTEQP
jgi:hypothetical protein